MKIFFAVLTFLFLSTNAQAINLGDSLKQVAGDQGKQLNENLDKRLDKITKDYEEKVDGYKKQLDGEVAKYKAQVKEAEDAINKLKDVKAKASYYINMVKTILALLSCGVVVLIFVMWRIWRNIVNMKKLLRNVTNYDDFNERLKKVEKLVNAK